MKKTILFLASFAFIFPSTSCGNNKISSLSQAYELSEDAFENTYNLVKDFYNKGFLGIQIDSSLDDKISNSKIDSELIINLDKNKIDFEEKKLDGVEFNLILNDEKNVSSYYLLDNILYYDLNNEKKYLYDISNYNIEESSNSDYKSQILNFIKGFVENLESGDFDLQISDWLNDKITTDQFYDVLMKNVNIIIDYKFDISKVFTNKDRKLFVSTLDVMKSNINSFINYQGDKSKIVFYFEKESLDEIKSSLYDNADESLRKILSSSQSTSYSDYCQSFYENLRKYTSNDYFNYQNIYFTLGINKKLIKSLSFEINYSIESKPIEYNLDLNFAYQSKPIIINRPDTSGEYEKIEKIPKK